MYSILTKEPFVIVAADAGLPMPSILSSSSPNVKEFASQLGDSPLVRSVVSFFKGKISGGDQPAPAHEESAAASEEQQDQSVEVGQIHLNNIGDPSHSLACSSQTWKRI